jgi:hypothetical protein
MFQVGDERKMNEGINSYYSRNSSQLLRFSQFACQSPQIMVLFGLSYIRNWDVRYNKRDSYHIRRPRRGRVLFLRRQQTGLWSTEAMVWGIVPKAAQHWGGDIPSGHRATPRCMFAFHPHGDLWLVTDSPVLVRLIWTTRNDQEKTAKVIKRGPVIQALQLTALFVGGAIWQQKQPHTILSVWL